VQKQIILLESNLAITKLHSIIRKDDLCYLLSKDYLLYLRLKNIVPYNCKVLNLAGRFNREIGRLRKGYLNLFADLSKKHDSLAWWCTHLASKNSASIPLQLNITYLFCAQKVIDDVSKKESNNRLIFIADSQALLESIKILGNTRHYDVYQPRKKFITKFFMIKLFCIYIYRIILFLVQSNKKRRLNKFNFNQISFNSSLKKTKIIVIRSWITRGTLKEDGLYLDRNFGELPNWLKSKGYKVIIMPMFFNLDKSVNEMFSLIQKQNFHFVNQEHYLKLIDYIQALYVGWEQINIPLNKITLEKLDLTLLFREVQLQEGFKLGNLSLNLCYPLMKRLKLSGIYVDRFYYPFENNVVEKPFILGCKNFFPNSEVFAYQHTVWYENQLGMFLGDSETQHPIADKIICSGPIYLDVLKKAGFPKDRLVAGPNLRFTSVHKDHSTSKHNIRRPNILLPLTYDIDLAYDLIHKIKLISKDFPGLFIYIRRHPLLNQKELTDFLNEIEMSNFQYADEWNMQDWLLNTDIVLSTGGSVVILETVAMGIPLIRVEPDNNFLLDPLAWTNYNLKPVNTPEEISNSINLILGMEKEEKYKIKEIGSEVLFNYFTEINENNIRAFN
jgi:hypothetical protein